MTSWKTSEIARRLAERDDVEPPEGLLEKIKSDIPAELPMVPTLPTLPRVPEIGPRPTPPKRRVWLMAASLAAAVCGGALGLWMMQNAEIKKQAMEETAPRQVPASVPTPAPPPPAVSREAPRRNTAGASAPAAPVMASPEVAPTPAAKEKAAADLKALGYVRGEGGVRAAPKPVPPAAAPPPPPAQAAAPRDEPVSVQAESRAASAPKPAEAPAGVIGGVAGGAPVGEKDERRADKDQEEMKKGRAPQDAQSALQKTPAAKTDRINAGGNEAEKQTRQLSAGAAAQPKREVSGDAMVGQSRQSLADGRLPSPETVRVEDFVNAYSSTGGRGFLARSGPAVQADGVPNPFAAEEDGRLLRVTVPATHDATVRIDFNPAVVASWRRLGSDRSQITATTRGDSMPAGSGITVLYAVTLKPETRPSQSILTLHLGQTTRDLHIGNLTPSWEKAAPDLRLVSLAAELAEVLRGSPWAQNTDLDDLVRRAKRVAVDLAGTPRAAAAADLVKMAEEAARLKR